MRLINCTTLRLEEFMGSNTPPYAILSHRWGKDEVSYIDFTCGRDTARSKDGYKKISFTCKQALEDTLQYAWVDTCCIDKSSSAELSEAINSMFQWYKQSTKCYVYLADVEMNLDAPFPDSEWFYRGWTLQELLAPSNVEFFDKDWRRLGTRQDHAGRISEITRIDHEALSGTGILLDVGLGAFCAAKRMSWASGRETTRVEDRAYCLLGIFNVNMPLLYGEGERAFIRLQEEIIKSCDDDSILAWGLDTEVEHSFGIPPKVADSVCGGATFSRILARSPEDFKDCYNLEYAATSSSPFTMTNLGLQIELPLVPVYWPEGHSEALNTDEIQGWIGLLNSGAGTDSELLGIILYPAGEDHATTKQVERVYLGPGMSTCTVQVGARVAAQAVRSKVTIKLDHESRMVQDYIFGSWQVIVNESNALQGIGYYVSDAFQPKPRTPHPKWNKETQVLTVYDSYYTNHLLHFHFKARRSCPEAEFSVLTRGSNAIVRTGSSFSRTEEEQIYDVLGDHSQQEDTMNVILTADDGNEFRVVVTTREMRVCHWRIVELDVTIEDAGEKEQSDCA